MNSQQLYAVKMISVEKYRKVQKLGEFTKNEIASLSKIDHENVIKFVEVLQTPNNVYLVYEFCHDGTLDAYIRKKKYLSEEEALKFFRQLVNGFKVLVEHNILHRDLKPSNILLNKETLKIADFGFCKAVLEDDLTKTMLGSPVYMAPEVLRGKAYNSKADIWSLGVVLYEMLFGRCPYD